MSSRRRRERRERGRGREVRSCCILCGSRRVKYGGMWFPTAAVQAKLLVPSNKSRMIGYGLCARCFRLPGVQGRVEDHVLADFAELAASPTRN